MNGNLSKIKYPNPAGGTLDVSYTYYKNNWLHKVIDWENKVTEYHSHSDGTMDYVSLPNGTTTTYSYHPQNRRMTGFVNAKSDGTVINSYTYTLDNDGNIKTETKQEPLALDLAAFMPQTATFHDNNFINTVNGVTQTVTPNGTLTNDGTHTQTFDNYEMMTSRDGVQHIYDALGVRIERIEGSDEERYVVDMLGNVIEIRDGTNQVDAYYIHGAGLLYRKTFNGSSFDDEYYHSNYQGSTVAMTDESEVLTHKYSYTAYGIRSQMEGVDDNPFTYVGSYGVMQEDSSLYFMRARFYDALTSRFVSEDPVWGTNLFVYSSNNPINNFDPNGRNSVEIGLSNDASVFAGSVVSYNEPEHFAYSVEYSTEGFMDLTDQFNTLKIEADEFFTAEKEKYPMIPGAQLVVGTLKAINFVSLVNDGKEFDIKRKGFSPENIGSKSIYKGDIYNYDDYGNELFGVYSKSYGYPLWFAIFGAGANQIGKGNADWTNFSGFFDHRRDSIMIRKGYSH